jgi:Flp pilus assembly protein CpaB
MQFRCLRRLHACTYQIGIKEENVENIMSSKLFTTRQGTVLLGVIAAVIAAIALLVYLNHYRNSANAKNASISVLVAKSLIQKGTPGNIVGSSGLYQVSSVLKSEAKSGAFVDPSTLSGKVALSDIYPGQQLTSADFGTAGNTLTDQLNRAQRAVVVPLDSPGEVGGQIAAGDHVDVWVAFTSQGASGITRPVVREILQDMYVMNAPAGGGGNVTLRATAKQAGQLIYAAQNATLWLVLRPTVGSIQTKAPTISATSLLGGAGR